MTSGGSDDGDDDTRVKPAASTPPSRRPITIQIPPKRAHTETRGRLPARDSRTPPGIDRSGSAGPRSAAEWQRGEEIDPAIVSAVISGDKTPLPEPVPHHVADPTLPNLARVPPPRPTPRPPLEPDDAGATLRALETADTGDLDISEEDTAPQDPAKAAAVGATVGQRDAGTGPFFAPLPPDRRAAVLARFFRRQMAPGMLVIRQGETKHPLYLVARGLLEVRAERADGTIVTLDHARDGDVVGEIGLLTHTPSPFQVIAATPVEVYALGPKDFHDIVGAFPALWAYLKELAERRQRAYGMRMKR
jgi:hypothetical protein